MEYNSINVFQWSKLILHLVNLITEFALISDTQTSITRWEQYILFYYKGNIKRYGIKIITIRKVLLLKQEIKIILMWKNHFQSLGDRIKT